MLKVKEYIFLNKNIESFITKRGKSGKKYRPVTDFVRVVSVGACPKPMTVDTPVIFILYKYAALCVV
jgi:hypothetical protein